jgi:hypothetical protein
MPRSARIRSEVLGRLMAAVGVSTLRQLAEQLGESYSTVTSWNARGRVPLAHLQAAAARTGASVDFILSGSDRTQNALSGGHIHAIGGAVAHSPASQVHARGGTVAHLPPPEDATGEAHSPQLRTQQTRHRGAFAAPPDATRAAHFPAREPPPPPLTAPRHAPLPAPLTLHLQAQDGQHQQQIAYAVIPHLRGGAAAGAGGVAAVLDDGAALADAERAGVIALQVAWLRRKLGAGVGPLASVEVHGHAMRPALNDGDTVILDTGCHAVRERGLYVLQLRGLRVIKRVRVAIDESVQVSEDAEPAAAETVAARDVDRLQVVGRIVWPRDW